LKFCLLSRGDVRKKRTFLSLTLHKVTTHSLHTFTRKLTDKRDGNCGNEICYNCLYIKLYILKKAIVEAYEVFMPLKIYSKHQNLISKLRKAQM